MKKTSLFLAASVFLFLMFPAKQVHAAAPGCFFFGELTGGITGTAEIPCDSGTFEEQYAALVGGGFAGLQDDTCYLISEAGGSETAGEVDCAEARTAVEETPDATVNDPPPFNTPGGGGTGVDTDKIQNPDRDHNENCSGGQDCLEDNELVIIAKVVVNLLSALVGIVVTIVIVLAGIQYASSGGNPQAVASARKSIVNGVIALVAFGLLWTGLQWLIPGGLF